MSDFKITGIIAEYNPFHSGHSYQLSKIKSDAVAVVMSGSFVERGDVAVADKWTRAALAIKGGADLIVELPVVFALNTAQKFAFGAVSLLDGMGVDELCFGSECGDIAVLRRAAEFIENEPREVSEKIKAFVSGGVSYAAAREKAYADIIPSGVLSEPNNILAVEYMRALIRVNSGITPITIKRIGADYNELTPSGGIASAAALREMLKKGENVSEFTEFNAPQNDLSRLDSAVIANLRMMSAERLAKINEVGEGLENRILRAAAECSSTDALANAVKTKRYTMSRIKRVLIASLLGITSEMSSLSPNYIRVLAMNEKGMAALKEIKKRTALTIITKAADYRKDDPMFNMDVRATDIAALCEKENRRGGRDYTVSPVILPFTSTSANPLSDA